MKVCDERVHSPEPVSRINEHVRSPSYRAVSGRGTVTVPAAENPFDRPGRGVNVFDHSLAERERRHRHLLDVARFRITGDVVEYPRGVASDDRIGGLSFIPVNILVSHNHAVSSILMNKKD